MRTGLRALACVFLVAHRCAAQGDMRMTDTNAWHGSAAATLYLAYVRTFGTRASYQIGSLNHLMLAAGGPLLGGYLQARALASAEPLTLTARGSPQLLQASFTDNGMTVTDHARPSPWIMELGASWDRALSADLSLLFDAAAVGEPALGPPVYLHRASAFANPAVPLGHHAQDVTHASFGVVTLGLRQRRLRLEVSAFNDRQPDNQRTPLFYDHARLDAYAARATFQTAALEFSASYGYLPASTGGHSHASLHRAGFTIVRNLSPWFVTATYGVNRPLGGAPSAPTFLLEGEHRSRAGHVLFARAEYVARTAEELALVGSVASTQNLAALEAGYARALASLGETPVRLGAYVTLALITAQLAPFYGTRTPLTVSIYGQYSWDSAHF